MAGRVGWLLIAIVGLGCGPLIAPMDETGSTSNDASGPSTTIGSTTVVTSVGETVGEVSTGVGSDEADDSCPDDCCNFLNTCGDFGTDNECDVWAQDCPEGEKCMPWANDGGSYWNATRCSPLDPRPGSVGEPCVVEGSYVSGIDDCGRGLQCLWVDPTSDMGECAASCEGSEAAPTCADPQASCTVEFDGTIQLCLPTCDPLVQDCMLGASCVPNTSDGRFVCAPTLAPTQGEHDVCASAWDCLPGNVCLDARGDPGCAGESCCFAFCDLMLGDVYCEGEPCLPWFADGDAPPGYEDVGVCKN